MNTKKLSYLVMGVMAVFVLGAWPVNIDQATAKDKGELKEVVHIYRKLPDASDFGKPTDRGKPVAQCTVTQNDNASTWGATGWRLPESGLTYQVNQTTIPGNLNTTDFLNAFSRGAATWEQVDTGIDWSYGGTTTKKSAKYDGVNLIAFGGASGGIAVTRTWYWTGTGEVAESDMIFASNLPWAITNPSAGDCGGTAGAYDVQNIATHELGHQVGLEDLYGSGDRDLTMYGYGTMRELKKDSLGTGDGNGAKTVTP